MSTFRWPDLPMTITGPARTAAVTGTNSDGTTLTTLAVSNDTTTLAVPNGTKLSAPTDSSVWTSETVSLTKKRSAGDANLLSVTSTKRDGRFVFEAKNGGSATDILEAGINMHYIIKKQKLDKEIEAAKEYHAFMKNAEKVLSKSRTTYTSNTTEYGEDQLYFRFQKKVTKESQDASETVRALEKQAALLPIQAEIVMIRGVMEKHSEEKASAKNV